MVLECCPWVCWFWLPQRMIPCFPEWCPLVSHQAVSPGHHASFIPPFYLSINQIHACVLGQTTLWCALQGPTPPLVNPKPLNPDHPINTHWLRHMRYVVCRGLWDVCYPLCVCVCTQQISKPDRPARWDVLLSYVCACARNNKDAPQACPAKRFA
jgi:hypothetical protein